MVYNFTGGIQISFKEFIIPLEGFRYLSKGFTIPLEEFRYLGVYNSTGGIQKSFFMVYIIPLEGFRYPIPRGL